MRRRDDGGVFGQLLDRGGRRFDAVFGVKKKERRSRAALDQVDPRAVDDERVCRALCRLEHFLSSYAGFKSPARCSTTASTFCHCVRLKAGGEKMADDGVTIHSGIAYANHDGVELMGDLYLPKSTQSGGAKAAPALVAVHGGGWVAGARSALQYWGPYLAARGIAVFAISYRLATKTKTFPEAVQDVL